MSDMETWMVAGALGRKIGDERRATQSWMDYAAELEQRVADLQDKLAMANCRAAGHLAVVEAFKQVHPNSPLLQTTNVVYKRGQFTGQAKRNSTLLWEQAFDAAGQKLGIPNPSARRDD